MLFNSVTFLLFLPLVVLVYYLLPHKHRWWWLLGASYVFYGAWRWELLGLIFFSTVVDYAVARWLGATTNKLARNFLLAFSLASNLGLLFVFKYLALFLEPIDKMQLHVYMGEHPFIGGLVNIVYYAVPVGISFYTFQTLSYTIDVYKKKISPERHLGHFALYVTFFPQLVAGPIERFSRLMPQLQQHHFPVYENFKNAFRLLLLGFFVKVCIADNAATWVNKVYENPEAFDLIGRWSGTFLFGLQIYADFYGYSLIAQGAALCLGIHLMDNFRNPYLASSISDFWQRWHISLSTWFRDYVYIPLGGSKVKALKWAINIMAVFALSGFWHGANWTFLIWGAIHGLFYLFEKATHTVLPGTLRNKILGWFLTFVVVNFAWIFFRSETTEKAFSVIKALFSESGGNHLEVDTVFLVMVAGFILFEVFSRNKRVDKWIDDKPFWMRWSLYALLLFAVLALGGTVNHPFIYFQF